MWIYITWIFWLGVHAAWYLWLLLAGGSVPLWLCFLQSWRGDPGVIAATHEDKLNVRIIYLSILFNKFIFNLIERFFFVFSFFSADYSRVS